MEVRKLPRLPTTGCTICVLPRMPAPKIMYLSLESLRACALDSLDVHLIDPLEGSVENAKTCRITVGSTYGLPIYHQNKPESM